MKNATRSELIELIRNRQFHRNLPTNSISADIDIESIFKSEIICLNALISYDIRMIKLKSAQFQLLNHIL